MSSLRGPAYSSTYQNPFQNAIFNDQNHSDMSSRNPNDQVYQNFTATGRPLYSSNNNNYANPSGLGDGLAAHDSYGQSAPNLLPVRFTDASIISVPVLPHAEPTQTKNNLDDGSSSLYTDNSSENPIKDGSSKSSRSRFSLSSFRRKSSSTGSSKGKQQDFIIREMTRGDYLKFYAKDDNGKYIGSEEPASDCILNREEDRVKYRRA